MSAMTRTAHGLDSGREIDWRQDAACKDGNPDWWTPVSIDSDGASWAAYVCLGCPVRRQCRDWAEANRSLCGGNIYAGTYYIGKTAGTKSHIRASQHQPIPRQPPNVRALLAERFGPVGALEAERNPGRSL